MQSCDYGFGVLGNDRKKSTSGSLRGPATAFPMFDGIKAKAKGVGESCLGHMQAFADTLYVDLRRHADLIAAALSCKEGIDFCIGSA